MTLHSKIRIICMLLVSAIFCTFLSCTSTDTNGGNTAPPTAEPLIFTAPPHVDLPDSYDFRTAFEEDSSRMARNFYTRMDTVSVMVGKMYGFCGLAKHELQDNGVSRRVYTVAAEGRVYTTARFLASAFGMTMAVTDSDVTLTIENTSIAFQRSKSEVLINGAAAPAYQVVEVNDEFMLDVENFAKIIGFNYTYNESDGIVLLTSPDATADSSDSPIDLAAEAASHIERYALYDRVVYDYSDVECDMTGVGVYEAVPQSERLVGIAYTTWHRTSSVWGEGHTWDMPLLGKYASTSKKMIYQHGVWLADAGVDFVIIDWSNNVGYDPETMRDREDFRTIEESVIDIFEIWATIPNAPKIAIFTGPGHVQSDRNTFTDGSMQAKTDQIYDTFIANEEFRKMYFYHDGKPLLLCYGATPSFVQTDVAPYDDDRFTTRWVTGFVGQQTNLFDASTLVSKLHWSWEERGAQTFTAFNNQPEAMTVVASWRQQSNEGAPDYIAPGLRNDGATFKLQWQRACEVGVRIALVVSFNEWGLGEQISLENSKDIEPSETFGTLYLDIMKEQIRKFKGQI